MRVAPPVVRTRSHQRGSTAFVVWHDPPPDLPPPRTSHDSPPAKRKAGSKKGAAKGKAGGE